MKRRMIIWISLMVLLLSTVPLRPAQAQIAIIEIIRAGIKRVIRAVDLKIQRMQNRTIWLQNKQKTLENLLSKIKLEEISKWTEKQKIQYQQYYLGLKKVRTIIAHYQQIRQTLEKQVKLVKEYERIWNLLRHDSHFTPDELRYMEQVYKGILQESLKNIDQIGMIIKSFAMEMSDAQRLELLRETSDRIEQNFNDLTLFNRQNILLRIQRARDRKEVETVKRMYNLP